MASTTLPRMGLLRGLLQFLGGLSRTSLLALVVGLATIVSGIFTYVTLTDLAPQGSTSGTLVVLFVVDLSLILTLAALIAWRLTRLWTERRSGAAGSRLHVRLVGTFA